MATSLRLWSKNHRYHEAAMFHRLIRTLDLHDGLRLPVRIGRHELLLLHEAGETWLVQRRCPHGDFPLERASLRDGVLRCPGHGLEFSLHSGRCRAQPAFCLKRYVLEFDGPWLGVSLDPTGGH
ncbi:Rieske (2Fe-2S) protein [Alloalcanivorax marinus]|uniref:Rieske (2Fe-2S) protein n=2 Tax=Alloalcanivorax TaxID=3020832 RepID=UPI001EE43013|nr:Rieske 2Fe-2S domain-containing protein [Alloalcanivorax marinus]